MPSIMLPAWWQLECKINLLLGSALGLPRWLSDKAPACQCRRQETWTQSLGREGPLEKVLATHSSLLAWGHLMDREAW